MPTEALSHRVVRSWLDAVNEKRIDAVLALYADDAVLLPTFSPHTLATPEQRRDYFERLAAKPGLSVGLHGRTVRVTTLPDGGEIVSGIYRWNLTIEGEPLAFEARFTYVLHSGAGAPIRHHHSSQIPRNL